VQTRPATVRKAIDSQQLGVQFQDVPPQYDVSTIETPIALYWGDSDWLATDKDVRTMLPQLKSVFSKTYLGEFNHMDFLWGARAPWEIYHPIMDDIKKDYGIIDTDAATS
jgi:hypothetical protein